VVAVGAAGTVLREEQAALWTGATDEQPPELEAAVLVQGGRERQDSVMAALDNLPADIAHVFIHDCARPLVRPEQLVALHKIVRRESAVVLAHRVTDTIKKHRANARLKTLDRDRLWAMETPQVFSRELIVQYLREVNSDLAESATTLPLEEVGRRMGIVAGMAESPTPVNVGLLFFSQEPWRFFPYTQIDVVWFPDGRGGEQAATSARTETRGSQRRVWIDMALLR
jgi:2-C-methyl-D-erythritol 4-phosphate cytidylyltransferase